LFNFIFRYKVDVEVFDGDEEAKFVFWDSSLEELLGMTASTLYEKQCQVWPLFLISRSAQRHHTAIYPFCTALID
jgi:hypothetical protein